jgi:hypothetical protein
MELYDDRGVSPRSRPQSLLGIGREPNIDSAVPAHVDALDRERIRTRTEKSSLLLIQDEIAIAAIGAAHPLSLIDFHAVEINGQIIVMGDT